MITFAALVARMGVDAGTLQAWVAQGWVRPRREPEGPVFEDIDVARVRLICELRDEMEVNEAAIPVVLSLLDQLHATRAQVRRMLSALEGAGPEGRVRDVVGSLLPQGKAG